MIRETMQNDLGETVRLTPGDRAYWDGPYRYEPFPKMRYRATGPHRQDWEYKIVQSVGEMDALGPAWCGSVQEAQAYLKKLDDEIAKAAAELQTRAQTMGPHARREVASFDMPDQDHLVDIQPRKRGRPRGRVAAPKTGTVETE